MSFIRQNKDLDVRFVEIDEHSANQRLDNFLLRELKKVPKSHIYRIVRSGEVRVNKGRKKPDYRLQIGDSVRIPPVKNVSATRQVNAGDLDWLLECIVFEDDWLLALNKPSGLAVHGGSGLSYGIIESLRKLRPELRFLELVHRLDRDTSGLLLLAKKRSALRNLHESMRGNRFNKHYTALVSGMLASRTRDVSVPLQKITRGGERIVVAAEDGKESRTYFTSKKVYAAVDATLVDIRLFTGRTHQARVHAATIGHPIAGDEKYGDKAFNNRVKALGLKRLFLHASWLQFPHPDTNTNMKLEAPLPPDLQKFLDKI